MENPVNSSISTIVKVKAVIAGGIGNAVEWYDFGIYAIFSSMIAANYFALNSPIVSLLATFATFAVGFFLRPLGAIIIGSYGDRKGRKKALAFSVILMGSSTFAIGIFPTVHQIGLWATILLLIARLAQGFSAGGEWGGNATFIIESVGKASRGFWGSWQQVSTVGGMLLGTLTGVILTSVMSNNALEMWGWRIPFIIGGLLGITGLILRNNVEETHEFQTLKEKESINTTPFRSTIKHHKKEMFRGVGVNVFWTVSYYGLLTYLPVFLSEFLNLPNYLSFVASTISMLILIILIPIAGYVSDKFGRKQLMLFSSIGSLILTYPLFLMFSTGSFLLILIGEIIFSILVSMYAGPGVAVLVEIFPTKVRYSSLSLSYNITTAIFGGLAPFISTLLINFTGWSLAPALYIIFAAVITTIGISRIDFGHFKAKNETVHSNSSIEN